MNLAKAVKRIKPESHSKAASDLDWAIMEAKYHGVDLDPAVLAWRLRRKACFESEAWSSKQHRKAIRRFVGRF